jgi:GNAT superfamily N-acetyltransferase
MDAIRPVPAAALGRYAALLCRLDAADRRRRFGRPMDDEAILDHVDALRRGAVLVLGAWRGIVLLGAVELARAGDGVELALAVAPEARGAGIGRRLLDAALVRAGGAAVRLSILAENRIVRTMAARAGFVVRAHGPELLMERPPASPPETVAA